MSAGRAFWGHWAPNFRPGHVRRPIFGILLDPLPGTWNFLHKLLYKLAEVGRHRARHGAVPPAVVLPGRSVHACPTIARCRGVRLRPQEHPPAHSRRLAGRRRPRLAVASKRGGHQPRARLLGRRPLKPRPRRARGRTRRRGAWQARACGLRAHIGGPANVQRKRLRGWVSDVDPGGRPCVCVSMAALASIPRGSSS